MSVAYIVLGLIIVGVNYELILPAFKSIFVHAFGVKALAGGFTGAAIGEVTVMVSDIVPETDAGKPGKN